MIVEAAKSGRFARLSPSHVDRQARLARKVVDRLPPTQLFDKLLSLGVQRFLLGFLAHRGFDLPLTSSIALLARLLDISHLEPDIAAVAGRHRLIVDAFVGGERGLEQVRPPGKSARSSRSCRVPVVDGSMSRASSPTAAAVSFSVFPELR